MVYMAKATRIERGENEQNEKINYLKNSLHLSLCVWQKNWRFIVLVVWQRRRKNCKLNSLVFLCYNFICLSRFFALVPSYFFFDLIIYASCFITFFSLSFFLSLMRTKKIILFFCYFLCCNGTTVKTKNNNTDSKFTRFTCNPTFKWMNGKKYDLHFGWFCIAFFTVLQHHNPFEYKLQTHKFL